MAAEEKGLEGWNSGLSSGRGWKDKRKSLGVTVNMEAQRTEVIEIWGLERELGLGSRASQSMSELPSEAQAIALLS